MKESVDCECGLGYVKPADNAIHNAHHRRWKDACREYGYIRTSKSHDDAKFQLREKLFSLQEELDKTASETKRKGIFRQMMDVQEDLYRVYYERSVYAWCVMLNGKRRKDRHCTFSEYVSLLLGQKEWDKIVFKKEVLEMLVKKYGKHKGMTGSFYEGRLEAA